MHLLLILTSSIKQVQTHSQNSSLLIIHIFIFRIRIINETLSDPKTAVTLQTSAGTESKHSPRTLQAKHWINPAICVSLPLLHGHLKHKYLLSWFGKYSTYTVYIPVLTNKISQTTTRGTPDSTLYNTADRKVHQKQGGSTDTSCHVLPGSKLHNKDQRDQPRKKPLGRGSLIGIVCRTSSRSWSGRWSCTSIQQGVSLMLCRG